MTRRLREREEELREKGRMVESATDEMLALEVNVNGLEARNEALERENRALVERWVRRVERDAEGVNRGSGWV